MIYESTNTHFSISTFCLQLFIHCGYPISLVACPNLFAQGYDLSRLSQIFFNHGLSSMIILMIFSYIISLDKQDNALVIPLVCCIMHRLMVALKYACLSKVEYSKFMSLPSSQLNTINQHSNQMQILTALLGKNDELLVFELLASAARLGIDLQDIKFEIPVKSSDVRTQISNWILFTSNSVNFPGGKLDESSTVTVKQVRSEASSWVPINMYDSAGRGESKGDVIVVPLKLLALSFLTSTHTSTGYTVLIVLAVIIVVSIFAIPFTYQEFGTSWPTVLFKITSTFVGVMFLLVDLGFLHGCLYYVNRQLSIAKKLSVMIQQYSDCVPCDGGGSSGSRAAPAAASSVPVSPIDVRRASTVVPFDTDVDTELAITRISTDHCQDEITDVPRVLLQSANNVFAWLYTRSLLQSFGLRMKFRLDAYMGALVCLGAALIAYAVISLLVSSDQTFLMSQLFLQTHLLIFIVAVYVFCIIFTAASANLEFADHGNIIMSQIVRVEYETVKCYGQIRELQRVKEESYGKNNVAEEMSDLLMALESKLRMFKETVEALSVAKDMIEANNVKYSQSILGIPCSFELSYYLVASILTYCLFLVTYDV